MEASTIGVQRRGLPEREAWTGRAGIRDRLSLCWKIAIGIVVILAVTMGVATWVSVAALQRAALRGAKAQAEAYGRPMILRAQELLGFNPDPSVLKVLAIDFRKVKEASAGLVFIAAVDPHGKTLAHLGPAERDRQLPTRYREALRRDGLTTLDAGDTLETFLPIPHQGRRVATLVLAYSFCHFYRAEVVDRLTGGTFQVRDVENHLQRPVPGRGVCRFRVEPRAPQGPASDGPARPMAAIG